MSHGCTHAEEHHLMESCGCGYRARMNGCWIAHYHDWSGAAVFASELEALRWAVDRQMAVKFVEFGSELR